MSRVSLPVASGGVELLKWIALGLMTLDHINAYLLDYQAPWLFNLGRLVCPIFALVLGYNLARPGVEEGGALSRSMYRMLAIGLVASPILMSLTERPYGTWPLNVMFMLALPVVCLHIAISGSFAGKAGAVLLFVVGGAAVEYAWMGAGIVLCSRALFRTGSPNALAGIVLLTAALYLINGNLWALAALPLAAVVAVQKVGIHRNKWLFYAYYPAHLGVLLIIQKASDTSLTLASASI